MSGLGDRSDEPSQRAWAERMRAELRAHGVTNELIGRFEAFGLSRREATIMAGAAAGIPDERLGEILGIGPRYIPPTRKAALEKLIAAIEGDVP